MAKAGATKDYKFGQKNHWRRTIWNEMLRRTNGREKTESIIYLAGQDDLDRSVAVEKGVPSDRLIAIDRDAVNVDSIRQKKCPAVRGDIFDVLSGWPESNPVCAMHLDLCQGMLSPRQMDQLMVVIAANPALNASILAINLQRGREFNLANRMWRLACDFAAQQARWYAHVGIEVKHRGALMYWLMIFVANSREYLSTGKVRGDSLNNTMLWTDPRFYTYRSGVLVFDSFVMSPISASVEIPQKHATEALGRMRDSADRSTRLRVNATLAVRTTRASNARQGGAL